MNLITLTKRMYRKVKEFEVLRNGALCPSKDLFPASVVSNGLWLQLSDDNVVYLGQNKTYFLVEICITRRKKEVQTEKLDEIAPWCIDNL